MLTKMYSSNTINLLPRITPVRLVDGCNEVLNDVRNPGGSEVKAHARDGARTPTRTPARFPRLRN